MVAMPNEALERDARGKQRRDKYSGTKYSAKYSRTDHENRHILMLKQQAKRSASRDTEPDEEVTYRA